ncbi:MAG: hypothetical protein ACFCAD_10265 [Pleurocapsa sp.]
MPQECEISHQNIKYEIAKIDRLIIFNLAHIFRYMELAKRIKDEYKLNSIDNFKLMLEQRKAWALSADFNHSFVHKLSQYLIDYYLTENRDD